jgi:hypothetical protein
MWIMLIKKLPTVVSPPKLSIFWAVPWLADMHKLSKREEQLQDEFDRSYKMFGMPDWDNAVAIFYKGEKIRVFPHEFSKMTRGKMHEYIIGNEGFLTSHELVTADVITAAQKRLDEITDEALKPIRDAALLDGASPEMAMQIAMGVDVLVPDEGIEDPDDDCGFPPIGWYRCHEEYAKYFCNPSEMEETDHRAKIEAEQQEMRKEKAEKEKTRYGYIYGGGE